MVAIPPKTVGVPKLPHDADGADVVLSLPPFVGSTVDGVVFEDVKICTTIHKVEGSYIYTHSYTYSKCTHCIAITLYI